LSMAKKRASLKDKGEEILGVKKGQGADILFGMGSEAESQPIPQDGSASTPEGMPQGEADLEDMLSAEFGAAVDETAPSAELDLDELLSAEAGAADATLPELATTPAAATPPVSGPPPTVERPAPAPPPTTIPSAPPADVGVPAAASPPSTETGAPDLSVPRQPRYRYITPVVDDEFDILAEEMSADAAAAARVGAPEAVRLSAEQRARLLKRRSVQQDMVRIEREIEGQYDRILSRNVSVSKPITDWCHNMLAEARTIVLNLQVERLAKAEWDVEQVRARLDRADESSKWSKRLGGFIAAWGIIWFGVFVYLVFKPSVIISLLGISPAGEEFLVPDVFLRALFFGGIGGVAAVFYHLFKYVRERSFDPQYTISYFGKPLMGMILGSIIYLTLFVLMRTLNILPSGLEGGEVADVTDLMYVVILYFVAMAAGFKENLAFDLLNRVVKSILGKEEESEELPTPPGGLAGTES
jgi:hypothetical protein